MGFEDLFSRTDRCFASDHAVARHGVMSGAMARALFPEAAATRFHGGVGLLYSSIAIGSIIAGLCSGWIGKGSPLPGPARPAIPPTPAA
jgi:hypothetical protein